MLPIRSRLAVPLRRRSQRRSTGQSLAEFAVILPVLLILVVLLIDVTRLYQTWIALESATRDAAQYLATSSSDPCGDDYSGTPPSDECTIPATADQKARFLLERATGATFTVSASQTACTTPMVTTSYSEDTSAAAGGSVAYPVGTGVVTACLPFRSLLTYPLGVDGGAFTLRSERTFHTMVGR